MLKGLASFKETRMAGNPPRRSTRMDPNMKMKLNNPRVMMNRQWTSWRSGWRRPILNFVCIYANEPRSGSVDAVSHPWRSCWRSFQQPRWFSEVKVGEGPAISVHFGRFWSIFPISNQDWIRWWLINSSWDSIEIDGDLWLRLDQCQICGVDSAPLDHVSEMKWRCCDASQTQQKTSKKNGWNLIFLFFFFLFSGYVGSLVTAACSWFLNIYTNCKCWICAKRPSPIKASPVCKVSRFSQSKLALK